MEERIWRTDVTVLNFSKRRPEKKILEPGVGVCQQQLRTSLLMLWLPEAMDNGWEKRLKVKSTE